MPDQDCNVWTIPLTDLGAALACRLVSNYRDIGGSNRALRKGLHMPTRDQKKAQLVAHPLCEVCWPDMRAASDVSADGKSICSECSQRQRSSSP